MIIDLRMTVLKRLAAGADARFNESYFINPIANEYHCQPRQVWEVLWGLVSEGLLYLDRNGQSGSDNWQWRLSTLGQVVASGSTRWEPRDVDGYLRRLRANKNPVDKIALRYMEEALRAFAARCYLASSVMLGTAPERVVIELASSVAPIHRSASSQEVVRAANQTVDSAVQPVHRDAQAHGNSPQGRPRRNG